MQGQSVRLPTGQFVAAAVGAELLRGFARGSTGKALEIALRESCPGLLGHDRSEICPVPLSAPGTGSWLPAGLPACRKASRRPRRAQGSGVCRTGAPRPPYQIGTKRLQRRDRELARPAKSPSTDTRWSTRSPCGAPRPARGGSPASAPSREHRCSRRRRCPSCRPGRATSTPSRRSRHKRGRRRRASAWRASPTRRRRSGRRVAGRRVGRRRRRTAEFERAATPLAHFEPGAAGRARRTRARLRPGARSRRAGRRPRRKASDAPRPASPCRRRRTRSGPSRTPSSGPIAARRAKADRAARGGARGPSGASAPSCRPSGPEDAGPGRAETGPLPAGAAGRPRPWRGVGGRAGLGLQPPAVQTRRPRGGRPPARSGTPWGRRTTRRPRRCRRT